MDPTQLDRLLRQSLADGRLDRAEQEGLAGYLRQHPARGADYLMARSRAFAAARAAPAGVEPGAVLSWLEDVLKLLMPPAVAATPQEVFFSPGESCLARIVERFRGAQKTADVCVFTITDDRIAREILAAHRRGVRVRVISDDEKSLDPGSDIEKFRECGVPTKVDNSPCHMHHKFAVFDRVRLLNGSYNWTNTATLNQENLVDTADPRLVAAFGREFDSLWAKL